jgi:hypothetical protein
MKQVGKKLHGLTSQRTTVLNRMRVYSSIYMTRNCKCYFLVEKCWCQMVESPQNSQQKQSCVMSYSLAEFLSTRLDDAEISWLVVSRTNCCVRQTLVRINITTHFQQTEDKGGTDIVFSFTFLKSVSVFFFCAQGVVRIYMNGPHWF